jgi:hypothetical protein
MPGAKQIGDREQLYGDRVDLAGTISTGRSQLSR